jgi:alpha-N-arabinofuranosidase
MRWSILLLVGLMTGAHADDFAHPAVYRDYPAGRWEDWSWANRDMQNATPVRTGQRSIRVDFYPWSSIWFKNPSGFVVDGFTHLEFWVHGGSVGNPRFHIRAEVNGVDRPLVPITDFASNLPANQWTRVQVPLSALGVNLGDRITGIHFREFSGQSVPTFYIDDIRFLRANVSNRATVTVNFSAAGRTITQLMRGINVACWDWYLTTPERRQLLRQVGFGMLRFPGGSTTNEYDWRNNSSRRYGTTYGTNTDGFLSVANEIGAEKNITINYGSGTPQEAADWVQYANIQRNGRVRYWTIGNENYGTWEHDTHPNRHDAHTYASFAQEAMTLMKGVDPTIKVGVVGVPNEREFAQRFSVTNPRTGQTQNGWTPVLLNRLSSLGVVPDFFDIHIYPQLPGQEDDASCWTTRALGTRLSPRRAKSCATTWRSGQYGADFRHREQYRRLQPWQADHQHGERALYGRFVGAGDYSRRGRLRMVGFAQLHRDEQQQRACAVRLAQLGRLWDCSVGLSVGRGRPAQHAVPDLLRGATDYALRQTG